MKHIILFCLSVFTIAVQAQLVYKAKAASRPETTSQNHSKVLIAENSYAAAEQQAVSVYPNPAIDVLHIRNAGSDQTTVEVVDILGQTLIPKTQVENSISLQSLPTGVYIVHVFNQHDQLVQSIRFMKQ